MKNRRPYTAPQTPSARRANDFYPTPDWVTKALLEAYPLVVLP